MMKHKRIAALLLALMRLSKNRLVKALEEAGYTPKIVRPNL